MLDSIFFIYCDYIQDSLKKLFFFFLLLVLQKNMIVSYFFVISITGN